MPNLPICVDARSASRAELEHAADALLAASGDNVSPTDDASFKETTFAPDKIAAISDARRSARSCSLRTTKATANCSRLSED